MPSPDPQFSQHAKPFDDVMNPPPYLSAWADELRRTGELERVADDELPPAAPARLPKEK